MTKDEDTQRTTLSKKRDMVFTQLFAVDIDMLYMILENMAAEDEKAFKVNHQAAIRDAFNRLVQGLAIDRYTKSNAASYFTGLRYENNEIDDFEDVKFHFRNDL